MLPPLQPVLSTLRSDAFRAGSSGMVMSCRLGMLTTIRLWATCWGENFREAIFSTVGLRGLASIPFNLRSEQSNTLEMQVRLQDTSQRLSLFSTRHRCPLFPHWSGKQSGCTRPESPRCSQRLEDRLCPGRYTCKHGLSGTVWEELEPHGGRWRRGGSGKADGRECTLCSVSRPPQTETLGDEPNVLCFWV